MEQFEYVFPHEPKQTPAHTDEDMERFEFLSPAGTTNAALDFQHEGWIVFQRYVDTPDGRNLCARLADEEDMRILLNLEQTKQELMAQSNRKGAAAEREIKAMLEVAMKEVYDYYNSLCIQHGYPTTPIPDLRTKDNNREHGSHDVSGIPWLAVEVKHHNTLHLPAWWAQTETQARSIGAEGALFFKSTRKTGVVLSGQWHVMTNMMKSPGKGFPMLKAPSIIGLQDWLGYFKNKLLWKLQNEPF